MDELEGNSKEENANNTGNDNSKYSLTNASGENDVITDPNNNKTNNKQKNWPSWIQAVTAIILIIITGTYTYYAREQVIETRKAVNIADDSNKAGSESMKNTLAEMGKQRTATEIAANAAKKSADIAEKTMVGTQRPWVSVRLNLGSGFKRDEQGGGNITIVFRMKNVGNSPAVGVYLHAEVILGFGPKDAIVEQKRILATGRRILATGRNSGSPLGYPFFGYMLFPGEEFSYKMTFGISREQIKQFETKMIKGFGEDNGAFKFIAPSIVGDVVYGFAFDKSVHRTGFIAEIFRVDPLYPNGRLIINSEDGDVPLNLLTLDISQFGSYAD